MDRFEALCFGGGQDPIAGDGPPAVEARGWKLEMAMRTTGIPQADLPRLLPVLSGVIPDLADAHRMPCHAVSCRGAKWP